MQPVIARSNQIQHGKQQERPIQERSFQLVVGKPRTTSATCAVAITTHATAAERTTSTTTATCAATIEQVSQQSQHPSATQHISCFWMIARFTRL